MLMSLACALLTSICLWQVACHPERTRGYSCKHKTRYDKEWEAAVSAQCCLLRQVQHSSGEQTQKQMPEKTPKRKRDGSPTPPLQDTVVELLPLVEANAVEAHTHTCTPHIHPLNECMAKVECRLCIWERYDRGLGEVSAHGPRVYV